MVLGNSYMSHIHHNGQFPKHLLVYSFIKSKTCPISPFYVVVAVVARSQLPRCSFLFRILFHWYARY